MTRCPSEGDPPSSHARAHNSHGTSGPLAPKLVGERRIADSLHRADIRLVIAAQLLVLLLLAACTRLGEPEGWSGGAVSGDILYIGTMEGDLRALDVDTGVTQCIFELESESPQQRAFYGTPAIDGDALFVGGYDGRLYAFSLDCDGAWDPDDQQLVGDGAPIVGSPVVADGVVLVGSSDGNLYAFDIDRGDNRLKLAERWRFPSDNNVWSTPVVSNGTVYFGSLDHTLYAVRLDDGQAAWPTPFTARGAIAATPTVANGRVYFGAFDGVFYAVDAETGVETWRFDEATDWFWAGTVMTADTIYAPSLDGNLYALDIDNGDLLWTLETGGPIIGSPVIVGEWIAVPSMHNKVAAVHLVRLADRDDPRRCTFGERNKVKIRASLAVRHGEFAPEDVEYEGAVFLAATDHSVRALGVRQNGSLDELWVHFTDRDIPLEDRGEC